MHEHAFKLLHVCEVVKMISCKVTTRNWNLSPLEQVTYLITPEHCNKTESLTYLPHGDLEILLITDLSRATAI